MKKILVLKGASAYNVLRKATDEICHGFENCGYEVDMIDGTVKDAGELLLASLARKQDYEFYFSLQALLWNEEKNKIPQLQEIRRVGWIVDDPIYHSARLLGGTGKNASVLIVRDSHAAQVRREYPQYDSVAALYHGGFMGNGHIDYMEKDIDVLFPGTYMSLKEAEDGIKGIDSGFSELAARIKERIVGKNLASAWQTELYRYLQEISFQVSEEEFYLLEQILGPLDYYQRAYMRIKVMESLLNSGIKVSVVGTGWENYEGGGKENLNIISNKGVDIEEAVELMGRSKIVLNNTNILDGMHERIFTAMLANAVCVTNEYDLLDNFFENEKEIVTFPLNHIERLPEIVKDLLENPQKAEGIANAGYQKALKNHTWQRRGEQIVKWLKDGRDFVYE